MKKALYIVAAIFFSLLACTLFTGLWLSYPVLASDTPTPFLANLAGFLLTTFISIYLFIAAKQA